MPRKSTTHALDAARHDYWLHVAMGLVGVLILLAMAAAASARRIVVPQVQASAKVAADLRATRLAAVNVERDVHALDSQIKRLNQELLGRKQERELIATLISAGEKRLAEMRGSLDQSGKQQYDLARNLALARAELERLEQQKLDPETLKPETMKVESYPTPLAKPVDSKELHLRLKDGRVTVLPIDELVDRLKNTVRERVWKLRDTPELTDTVGPVDGFRMRYTMIRVDARGQAAFEPGAGSYVTLDNWELVPVAEDLGESWQEAMGPRSLLRAKLDQTNPRLWTVTLWVYPDSFDAFRALRKEFYERGYHVAGRPLPDDVAIGGSPRGTKSAAQ